MQEDEEQIAARSFGDLLSSTFLGEWNRAELGGYPVRDFLYCWERDALQWLIRFKQRRPDGSIGNDWTHNFMQLNHDMILGGGGKIDFNLRAFSELQKANSK